MRDEYTIISFKSWTSCCQIFRTKTLEKSFALASSNEHYEHVTLHIRENPEIFSTFYLPTTQEYFYPKLRLTLDYEKDYLLIKKLLKSLPTKICSFPWQIF